MRKIIYMGAIGFLFVMGFLNLDGNDWQPVELPKFATNFFDSGERILPSEEWRDILIGKWDYIYVENDEPFKGRFEGTVNYDSSGTFVRAFKFVGKVDDGDYSVSGSFRGKWQLVEKDNAWIEDIKEEEKWTLSNDDYNDELFFYFNFLIYGSKSGSDLWENKIVYFNHSRIEIISEHLGEERDRIYKFTRATNSN